MNELNWQVQCFTDLSTEQLFNILEARQAVFVVEQECPYPDISIVDKQAWHLTGWTEAGEVAAYARILRPGLIYSQTSIGRVLTTSVTRGSGLGRELMNKAIAFLEQEFPAQEIKIGAQQRLEIFYQSLGFKTISEPYDEDGIMHIEMLKSAKQ